MDTDFKRRIHAVLGNGGLLAQRQPGYEERPAQLQMAEAVASALLGGHHAVIEAGTGTGKTLAYLVPAVLSGRKVVVSTATKALQEQLFDKDLPLLHTLAGGRFRYALLKGRSNYLCQLRFERFDVAPTFASRDEAAQYVKLRTWASKTETGDRAELDIPESFVPWRDVSSTSDTCLGEQLCPRAAGCHVLKARQRAAEADVVVVNHHLFFADLSLRQGGIPGREILPRPEAVLFDEAHRIEDIATDFFGHAVGSTRCFDLCRDADRLVAGSKHEESKRRVNDSTRSTGHAADAFFAAVAALAPVFGGRNQSDTSVETPVIAIPVATPLPRTGNLFDSGGESKAVERSAVVIPEVSVRPPPPADDEVADKRWTVEKAQMTPVQPLGDALVMALEGLDEALASIPAGTPEQTTEIDGLRRRVADARDSLQVLTAMNDTSLVYWAETRGRSVMLRAAPIDIASSLRSALFDKEVPVVLTSATLAAGGDTSFFRRRVGLMLGKEDVRPTTETILSSPFDYPRQAALYVPGHLPEPQDPAFLNETLREIVALIALAGGRTFLLFTSRRAMTETHRQLAARIQTRYPVLLQGQKPKGALIREFRERPSVLFATQSFWEGVDIAGDALSLVVIDKIPFASPEEPIVKARTAAIEARGGSSFGEYALPSAAITLKQGFGRLIRTRADTGVVAILDRRLWTKAYGGYLRRSLPPAPVFDSFGEIKRWWNETRQGG